MARLRRRTGWQLPRLRLRRGIRGVRGRPQRAALLLWGAVFVAGVMLMCAVLERRVTPQVQALAETAARQQASEAISEAVQTVLVEEKVTYETLVGIHVENGVRSIETNAMEINLLRSKINQAVEKAVRSRKGRLRLPLGALLGSQLFAGAGPKIGVPLAMTGDAVSDIRSDISGAGVNQTNYLLG